MRPLAQDLEQLRAKRVGQRSSVSQAEMGWARAFVRLARAVEPDLVIRDGMRDSAGRPISRADWWASLEDLEHWIDHVSDPQPYRREFDVRHIDTLVRIALAAWVPPRTGPVRAFPFIQHSELRAIAERAYTSALDAAKIEDHLVTVAMAASAVEAMLYDFLERSGVPLTDGLLKKTLGQLIKQDCQPPRLKQHTFDSAVLLKDHRNRIHPGRAILDCAEEPTRADALHALALLERLVEDLA